MFKKIKFSLKFFFLLKNTVFMYSFPPNYKLNLFFINKFLFIYTGKFLLKKKFNLLNNSEQLKNLILTKKPYCRPLKSKKLKIFF